METINNTILIIEDDLGLNELISEKIKELGFQTYSVFSVDEAINWLSQFIPHLMVVDYSLSGSTAKDFIDFTKSKGLTLPPFVVTTGQGDERIAVEMMKLGARDYIIKDTNLLELLPSIIVRVANEIMNENKLKIAENELHNNELRFKVLFADAPDAMLLADPDSGLIVDANNAALLLFKKQKSELVGMFQYELHPSTNIELSISTFKIHFEKTRETGKNVPIENSIVTSDGTEIPVEVLGRTIQIGEKILMLGTFRDITERKRAQQKLAESEMRFRKLLQDIQTVSVQGYASDGTTQYWNKASEILYGYTAEEAIGKNLIDLIIPTEMRTGVKQAMERMAESGQPIPASELALKRKDGKHVTVISNHAIVQVDGQPQELFCIDIDLTEIKQAQEALRKSEEKFRILFADNPQPMFVYNINTCDILEVNQTAVNFYGYTKEECLKMTIKELHPSEDIPSFLEMMEQTKMGINTDGITKHIKKNGEIIIVEIFSAAANYWGENARLALVVDISERKKVELAILDSEAKMKKVLIESSILIDSNSKDTDYQKITNTIAEISGAKYVSFDVVNYLENKIQTYALSGIKENVLKISSMLGYDIVNKRWNYDPIRAETIKNQIVTHFDSLNEITSSQIPLQISKLIEKTFNLGKVVIVKIAKGSETIAFFTLFFSKDKSIQNTDLVELFANQVSLYMERKKAEEALIKKNTDLDYMNKFMVNREVRMADMKKEVNELLERLGEEKRYL